MDRQLTDTVYPGFFPETLYSSQCVEISTDRTVANSWELGQCFLKGCVQTWALLLRSWVTCFLCHNCFRITGRHCPDSSSDQKDSQLLEVLSANSRGPLQKLLSPKKSQLLRAMLPSWVSHKQYLVHGRARGRKGGMKARAPHSHSPCSNSRPLWRFTHLALMILEPFS